MKERYAGVLLPITALPSPYGVGTFGAKAKEFVDFLVKSGQEYWQILPIGPTGFGDSPYQSYSAYAGNPLLIDLEKLIYISSAGLRVLLSAQKKMQKIGSMKVTGVCEAVMEVFEMTGFADILTIE